MLLKSAQGKFVLCSGLLLALSFGFFARPGYADLWRATSEFQDPLLRVQLPPATRLLIIGLIYIAQLEGGRTKKSQMTIDDQVALLRRLFTIIEDVYGKKNQAIPKKRISSLADAIYLLEPTRGRTGDGYTDIERLLNAQNPPPQAFTEKAVLDEDSYGNPMAQGYVARWIYLRDRLLKESLTGLGTATGTHRTLVQAILAGVVGGLVNRFAGPGGVTQIARDVQKASKSAKERRLERQKNQSDPDAPSSGPAEVEDLVADFAGSFADQMERTLGDLSSEQSLLGLVRQLKDGGDADLEGFISAFQAQLNTVVKNEVYAVTGRIVQHFRGNLAADQRDTLKRILEVLFDEYLRQAEPYVIKNILIDLLSTPVGTSEEDAFRIVVKHFGPIVKNLLQTIGHIANIGPLQTICKSLQDSGAGVSFEQVKEIFARDPNGYKLVDLKDEIMADPSAALAQLARDGAVPGKTIVNMNKRFMKAGKIAQVHSAYLYLQNDKGFELRPIVVRILIPGAKKMLEEEKRMLVKLSPKLAAVFTDYAGRTASPKRINELIYMLYEHLFGETDLALTVMNQNIARKRLRRSFEVSFRHDRTKGIVELDVPFAFPAEPKSEIMLQDLVNVHPWDEEDDAAMEVARKMTGCFMTATIQEIVLNPYCEPQEVTEARENEGFAHGDPHLGQFLPGEPYLDDQGRKHYPVHITDFGLVVWVPHDKLQYLVDLIMGANFNSVTTIAQALWNLREPDPDFDKEIECQSYWATRFEVDRVVKHLRTQVGKGRYWNAGDWIKQFWLFGQLNFPRWLLQSEQVFRALNSSLESIGLDDKDMRVLYKDLEATYKWKLVRKRARGAPIATAALAGNVAAYCLSEIMRP